MDPDEEARKFKIGAVVVIAFLISTFMSCQELKYSTSGKTAQATADRVYQTTSPRGVVTKHVQYHYHDEGGHLRNANDTVPNDWTPPKNETITIEYLSDTSRIAGHRNYLALTIFFASLGAMIVGGILFVRHVREATKK
ncbi:MAG TPA: hypothetical protein VH518_19440 [Tepidisphaeraceae bacterium]|jgi:hypothetical protein